MIDLRLLLTLWKEYVRSRRRHKVERKAAMERSIEIPFTGGTMTIVLTVEGSPEGSSFDRAFSVFAQGYLLLAGRLGEKFDEEAGTHNINVTHTVRVGGMTIKASIFVVVQAEGLCYGALSEVASMPFTMASHEIIDVFYKPEPDPEISRGIRGVVSALGLNEDDVLVVDGGVVVRSSSIPPDSVLARLAREL